MAVYLLVILITSVVLFKASDLVSVNIRGLAQKTGLGQMAIASLLLALTTSFPELFVGLTSAWQGQANLSLGNVIGANIANLSLVVGGAALWGGDVAVRGSFLRKDVFYTFLAGLAPLVLLVDGRLGRLDGLVLIIIYLVYCFWIFGNHNHHQDNQNQHENAGHFLVRQFKSRSTRKELFWILTGIGLLLLSAQVVVACAKAVALGLGVPVLLVGLLVVSVGTTLPELVISARAVAKKMPQMVFGNVLGSIAANGTLILGLVALLSPINEVNLGEYLLAIGEFVLVFTLFYLFIRSKNSLARVEGLILVLTYCLFVVTALGSGI